MSDIDSSLEKLKVDAANEDSADSFMEPGKKRRGRPKGAKNKTSQNPMGGSEVNAPPVGPDHEKIKQLVRPGVEAISLLGVKIAEDKDAAMQPTEMEIIVETAALCVNQYLPGALGQHANAIVLMVTLSQWSLRVYLLRQANLERLRQEKKMREVSEMKKEN